MSNGRDRKSLITRRDMLHAAGAVALAAATGGCSSTPVHAGVDVKPLKLYKSEEGRARCMAAYDSLLKVWPVAYESLRIPTRYGQTHVIASGPVNAPPLILLPAFTATAGMYRSNVAAWSERFRTYAVDTIGEPNKSEPTRAQKSRRDCTDWIVDLMDALRIERASFVGSSLGGFRALNQTLATPDRIDRTVLISPAALPLSWKFYWYATLRIFGSTSVDDWMGNGVPFDPVNQRWADLFAAVSTDGRIVNSLSLGAIPQHEWTTLSRPTLLLIGDKEVIYSRPYAEVLERARSHANITAESVPNANHLAAMANPSFVNERVLKFLTAA